MRCSKEETYVLLVTGATGNVGGEVVAALRAGGEPVRALARTRSADFPEDVEVALGNLDDVDSLAGALRGVRGVFLLAGYADMPGLLHAMKDAGVEHVVLLSSGCVAGGDLRNVVVRYNVVSEAAVLDSGVAWTILRPSGFHANALRWLPQLRAGDVVREPFADVPVASIDPADIAAVAASALTSREHDAAIHRLTGPRPLLPAERLAILAELIGRDLRLEPLVGEAARQFLLAGMPPPYVDAFFDFFDAGSYDDSRVDPTLPQLLGRPARDFRDWAVTHADAFR